MQQTRRKRNEEIINKEAQLTLYIEVKIRTELKCRILKRREKRNSNKKAKNVNKIYLIRDFVFFLFFLSLIRKDDKYKNK